MVSREAIAKYSVLTESKQLFASKYLTYLPTEQQLKEEIEYFRYTTIKEVIDHVKEAQIFDHYPDIDTDNNPEILPFLNALINGNQ